MEPESWLEERSRVSRTFMFSKVLGIGLESKFLANNNFCKLFHFLIELGILPEKRLSERSMVTTFSRRETSSGKGPLKKFFDRLKTMLKLGRLKISLVKFPLNLLLDKSMERSF